MKSKLFWGVATMLLSALTANFVSAHENDGQDPADPQARVPRAHYHPVITDYRLTPVMTKPGNWRALNDRAEKIGGPRGQLREVDEPIRQRKKR